MAGSWEHRRCGQHTRCIRLARELSTHLNEGRRVGKEGAEGFFDALLEAIKCRRVVLRVDTLHER